MMRVRRGLASYCNNGLDPAGNVCFDVTGTGTLMVASAGPGLPCVSRKFPYVGGEINGACNTSDWFTWLVAGLIGYTVVRGITR